MTETWTTVPWVELGMLISFSVFLTVSRPYMNVIIIN